jgi:hypothetical protein
MAITKRHGDILCEKLVELGRKCHFVVAEFVRPEQISGRIVAACVI